MELLVKEVSKLLKEVGIEKPEKFEVPPDEKFGDLAFPCFNLAKEKKKSPSEIAREIAGRIKKTELIEKVKPVSGYINFFFNWGKVAEVLLKKIVEKKLKPEKVYGKKIMVEHTSVNPNKALHIGHLRNACLGDSLRRLLEFLGEEVVVTNYIDDTGAQMADIILAFKFLGFPLKTEKKFDEYCGEVYVRVNKLYKENPELEKKRKFVLKEIEKGDTEIARFNDEIVEKVVKAQLKTLWRLGIFYDLLNKESDIVRSGFWEKAFSQLKEKGLVYLCKEGDKKGCWLLRLSFLPEFKSLKNPDITIVRSDGTVLYVGKDIAYAMWKHGLLKEDFLYKKFILQPNGKPLWTTTHPHGEREHPTFNDVDISLNVIDVRQSHEQGAVASALKLISKERKHYIHYAYEVVALSRKTAEKLGLKVDERFVHMSGRKGLYINADTLLEALFTKAYEETKKRNPNESEDFLRSVAEKIAIAAIRYELEKISPEKMIVFDMDKALKLEENTGPYLQYTYTRCSGILRKAKEIDFNFSKKVLEAGEKKLVKLLIQFPDVVKDAAKDLRINYICNYAFELSKFFNKFYEKYPVLKAEDEVKKFRIALVFGVKTVLEQCFQILGIKPLERM